MGAIKGSIDYKIITLQLKKELLECKKLAELGYILQEHSWKSKNYSFKNLYNSSESIEWYEYITVLSGSTQPKIFWRCGYNTVTYYTSTFTSLVKGELFDSVQKLLDFLTNKKQKQTKLPVLKTYEITIKPKTISAFTLNEAKDQIKFSIENDLIFTEIK